MKKTLLIPIALLLIFGVGCHQWPDETKSEEATVDPKVVDEMVNKQLDEILTSLKEKEPEASVSQGVDENAASEMTAEELAEKIRESVTAELEKTRSDINENLRETLFARIDQIIEERSEELKAAKVEVEEAVEETEEKVEEAGIEEVDEQVNQDGEEIVETREIVEQLTTTPIAAAVLPTSAGTPSVVNSQPINGIQNNTNSSDESVNEGEATPIENQLSRESSQINESSPIGTTLLLSRPITNTTSPITVGEGDSEASTEAVDITEIDESSVTNDNGSQSVAISPKPVVRAVILVSPIVSNESTETSAPDDITEGEVPPLGIKPTPVVTPIVTNSLTNVQNDPDEGPASAPPVEEASPVLLNNGLLARIISKLTGETEEVSSNESTDEQTDNDEKVEVEVEVDGSPPLSPFQEMGNILAARENAEESESPIDQPESNETEEEKTFMAPLVNWENWDGAPPDDLSRPEFSPSILLKEEGDQKKIRDFVFSATFSAEEVREAFAQGKPYRLINAVDVVGSAMSGIQDSFQVSMLQDRSFRVILGNTQFSGSSESISEKVINVSANMTFNFSYLNGSVQMNFNGNNVISFPQEALGISCSNPAKEICQNTVLENIRPTRMPYDGIDLLTDKKASIANLLHLQIEAEMTQAEYIDLFGEEAWNLRQLNGVQHILFGCVDANDVSILNRGSELEILIEALVRSGTDFRGREIVLHNAAEFDVDLSSEIPSLTNEAMNRMDLNNLILRTHLPSDEAVDTTSRPSAPFRARNTDLSDLNRETPTDNETSPLALFAQREGQLDSLILFEGRRVNLGTEVAVCNAMAIPMIEEQRSDNTMEN